MSNRPFARRRIYLMRHADVSYYAAAGRPYRSASVPLTEAGRRQARAAAEALAEVPLDRAIVSGLARTIETARIVVGDRPIPLEERPALQEIRGGRVTELPGDRVEAAFRHAFVGLRPESTFLGGEETFGAFGERVVPCFHGLGGDDGWQHLLIVAHGGTNRVILLAALGAGLAGYGAIEQDAGCLNVLDVEGEGDTFRAIVRLVNYTPYNSLKLGIQETTMERLYRAFRPMR
jgi:broad specificity phosphatase PhoE